MVLFKKKIKLGLISISSHRLWDSAIYVFITFIYLLWLYTICSMFSSWHEGIFLTLLKMKTKNECRKIEKVHEARHCCSVKRLRWSVFGQVWIWLLKTKFLYISLKSVKTTDYASYFVTYSVWSLNRVGDFLFWKTSHSFLPPVFDFEVSARVWYLFCFL